MLIACPSLACIDDDSSGGNRIFQAATAPVDARWMWTLIFGYHKDRTPTPCL
jgi:hypothetical protein